LNIQQKFISDELCITLTGPTAKRIGLSTVNRVNVLTTKGR